MIVEQIWTGNAFRNFNYLIACEETGEALAVDPLDHEKCLATARDHGWTITQVLNTHEHFDHTGGNADVIAATGASLLAHVRDDVRQSVARKIAGDRRLICDPLGHDVFLPSRILCLCRRRDEEDRGDNRTVNRALHDGPGEGEREPNRRTNR